MGEKPTQHKVWLFLGNNPSCHGWSVPMFIAALGMSLKESRGTKEKQSLRAETQTLHTTNTHPHVGQKLNHKFLLGFVMLKSLVFWDWYPTLKKIDKKSV